MGVVSSQTGGRLFITNRSRADHGPITDQSRPSRFKLSEIRCSICNYLRLVHQQMTNTHLSASSKERGNRAAEFQFQLLSQVKMSVKV